MNVCAVADDDQCLVEGTLITMAHGSRAPDRSVPRQATKSTPPTAAAISVRATCPQWRAASGKASEYPYHDALRAYARQHTRAYPLCGVSPGRYASTLFHLPYAQAWSWFPHRDVANLHKGPGKASRRLYATHPPRTCRCGRGFSRRTLVRMRHVPTNTYFHLRYRHPHAAFRASKGQARSTGWCMMRRYIRRIFETFDTEAQRPTTARATLVSLSEHPHFRPALAQFESTSRYGSHSALTAAAATPMHRHLARGQRAPKPAPPWNRFVLHCARRRSSRNQSAGRYDAMSGDMGVRVGASGTDTQSHRRRHSCLSPVLGKNAVRCDRGQGATIPASRFRASGNDDVLRRRRLRYR